MTVPRILILGGTTEAREIANRLFEVGRDITTSLAGVTRAPILPKGRVRVGGFGGVNGLVDYLRDQRIDLVIDATHPFAATMSANAEAATQRVECELLRFERPAWQRRAGDQWVDVMSIPEAAFLLPPGAVALVTTGRKELAAFFVRKDISGLIRTVEPVSEAVPEQWRVILDRPPQSCEDEVALLRDNFITHLVSKNAGGERTLAKLDAARICGIPVIMVQRPRKPSVESFSEIDALLLRLGTSGVLV